MAAASREVDGRSYAYAGIGTRNCTRGSDAHGRSAGRAVDAADAALARLTALAELPNGNALVKVAVAEVHAFRGNEGQAFDTIEKILGPTSTRETTAATIWARQVIHRSPFFTSLRTHDRWQPLLANFALGAHDHPVGVE
jgi:hypothetical protein